MNQADCILGNAYVLTMDDVYHAYPRGAYGRTCWRDRTH